MKINNQKIVDRWNIVMGDVCVEHITINTELSELEERKEYYDVESGVSVTWMLKEAKYWLSCYYEEGNVRCDDRFLGEEEYAMWKSETGKLKRLITRLEAMEDCLVVEWDEQGQSEQQEQRLEESAENAVVESTEKKQKYIVVEQRLDGNGDIWEYCFDTAEEANDYAECEWKHLTDREQKKMWVFVGLVTEDCLSAWAIDEDTGEIDWTCYNAIYTFDGAFDSNAPTVKYIGYAIYECPNHPTEYGKYIGKTPYL